MTLAATRAGSTRVRISKDLNIAKDWQVGKEAPMIQGVHAETVVFVEFDRATELIGVAGWPWLGRPGAMSAREVSLDGGAPRRFRVRAGQLRILKGKEVSCSVQLERPEGPMAALVRAQLTLTPVPKGGRTRLSLRGVAARDLVEGLPSTTDTCLRMANTYARSLLVGVATAMEAGNHPPLDRRPDRRPVDHASMSTWASGSD